ncbi:MAG: DUF2330 domain-containing protein, partial [Chloroflexi bacterium]|nr:DUF2330 domain-containing protein [Chloroflexota bacterium]
MRALIATLAVITAATVGLLIQHPGLADACAGLIGSNGNVNLGRTTTLAAYTDGVEHYVTSFEFQGGGGEFGTLIPLPDVPTNVERGGDWTLQRLQLETAPPVLAFGATALRNFDAAEVILEVRIDALDITVLRGGGPDVAAWATENGFRLSPDAPEVLDFYAQRSPIFLAAVFDGAAAAERGQVVGDGTPVHITIPTDDPWVPLRILALGKQPGDLVQADVFLLTDGEPALLPAPSDSLVLTHSKPATDLLLDDLRSDTGMDWMPDSAWLTKLEINSAAADLTFDLAIDVSGDNNPSVVDAGLALPTATAIPSDSSSLSALWLAAIALAGLVAV